MGEVLAKSLCRNLSTALGRWRQEDPGAGSCLAYSTHSRLVRDPISINNVGDARRRAPKVGLWLREHTCVSILLVHGSDPQGTQAPPPGHVQSNPV